MDEESDGYSESSYNFDFLMQDGSTVTVSMQDAFEALSLGDTEIILASAYGGADSKQSLTNIQYSWGAPDYGYIRWHDAGYPEGHRFESLRHTSPYLIEESNNIVYGFGGSSFSTDHEHIRQMGLGNDHTFIGDSGSQQFQGT